LRSMDAGPTGTVAHSERTRFLGSGGTTCAFLRDAFASGLPSGFGIAEVGVWHGDTSLELVKLLPNDGFLHLFDYESVAQAAKQRLADAGHNNVSAFGCSTKDQDSYNWSLMRLLITNPLPIYDYVYLDGAHTWAVDGLAFFLLDRLLKIGGHMDFDDYNWTMASSPTQNPVANPHVRDQYTDEQIRTSQVTLIVELLVKRDRRYQEAVGNKIFRKVGA
jgi:Methyltransferase domain